MKTQIQQARDAGYSDEEIANFLSKKDESQASKFSKAIESGYTSTEILNHLHESQQPSRARSLISAPLKGIIKGLQGINPLSIGRAVPQKVGERLTEQFLPTQEKGPEQFLERAGKLAPLAALGPEGLSAKVIQLAAGAAAGHIAKENDLGEVGQIVSEAIGMGAPGLLKGIGQKAIQAFREPAEKFTSGLTKPRAVMAKHVEKAIVTPQNQERAIAKLNEEAATLTKGIAEKERPFLKKIEEGFDFEGKYNKDFERLRKAAEKANPQINITPVSNLLSKTIQKYRGIPKLHPEGKKVVAEIQALADKPQTGLKNLLKIYRSNNQKIKNTFETSRLKGTQKEYTDFLLDVNKNIAKSFENTLPADSAWLKEFKGLNSEYKQFKDTIKTQQLLDPIIGGKPDANKIKKIANDKKLQKKLEMVMGKKGSDEVIQISRDLEEANKALKRMTAKELGPWDVVAPLSLFIPNSWVAAPLTLKKAADFARRGYGYFLSTSSRRKQYDNILKAIISKDKEAYIKAAKKLTESLQEED